MSPRIENNRLLLRPWQDDDAPLLYRYASDPDVGPRAGWAPHQSVEESLHIIQTVFRNPTTWAIIRKEDDLLVGAIGYGPSCDCHLPAREGEPTVGYWVAKPFWNQGLCTEALQLLIAHLRQQNESNENNEVSTHSIPSLISGHFIDNPASGRVMEKSASSPLATSATIPPSTTAQPAPSASCDSYYSGSVRNAERQELEKKHKKLPFSCIIQKKVVTLRRILGDTV